MSNKKKEFFLVRWFKRCFLGDRPELSDEEEERIQTPVRAMVANFVHPPLAMIGLLGYYLRYLGKRKTPAGVLVGLTLILAGAIGNMIDSAFYGLIFSASTPTEVAHFGGSYAPLMMGRVVDMFYFPLFQWNGVPGWLSFLVDSRNYFFGAIFNLADAYISVAVVYLLIFQYKFFK